MKCAMLVIFLLLTGSLAAAEDYDFVVAQDGTGNFTTIQAAIYAVRDFKPGERAVILVRNGVYNEKVVIPTYKCNILLRGEDVEKTVIVCNDYAALNGMGTFKTYTLLVAGNDIEIVDMTVSNTAGRVGQAVAVHVEGDRVVFRNCRLLGNQDTVFAGREGPVSTSRIAISKERSILSSVRPRPGSNDARYIASRIRTLRQRAPRNISNTDLFSIIAG